MGIARYITVAGQTIFTKLICERRPRVPGQKRAPKENTSTAAVRNLNEKYAIRDLALILNHNFKPYDYHLILTYAKEPPAPDQAKKNLEKFCRKMNEQYKKAGIHFKRVSVTEYHNHRIHHHIVCTGGATPELLAKLWPHGYVRPVALDESGDYRKLAEYLIKETNKHFRDPDAVNKRRYNCSRSIERPITKKEPVSFETYKRATMEPTPFNGYYIDQDSVYIGEDPLTGLEYVEYVQISMTDDPRIKKYKRGKKSKTKNPYKQWLDQNEPTQIQLQDTDLLQTCGGLLGMAEMCEWMKGR